MTAPAGEEQGQDSVLSSLDSAATSSFYWYLAALSCVGGFLFGYDTAVIGSVLVFIPYHLGSFATGTWWREPRSVRRWVRWGLGS